MAHEFHDGVYFDPRVPRATPDSPPRPAVFLDRDGCIIELGDYLHKPADVRLIDGAAGAIADWNRRGVPVVIATNQSGIGRYYYDWDAFIATQAEVDRQLAPGGGKVDAVAACPFHPDALPPYNHTNHPARKPNPGMLQLAADWMRLDLRQSWIVGDSHSDMKLVDTAGLVGGVHVGSGYGSRDRDIIRSSPWADGRVHCVDSWSDVPRTIRIEV